MANFTIITEEMVTFYEDNVDVNMTTTDMEIVDVGEPRAPRPPDYQGLVLGTTLIVLIILMNFISLVAFAIEKRLRTYNNYFIINLSIADLALGINQTVGTAHTFIGYFPFNQDICKFYVGFRNALFSVSVVGVVVICIDRHRATYDPINHFVTRSKRKAMMMNALTWLITFGFWMPYTAGWDFAIDYDNGRHCVAAFSRSTIGNIFQNVLSFFVPLVIITVLYLRIFLKIKETVGGKSVNEQFEKPNVGGKLAVEPSSNSTSLTTVSIDVTSNGVMEQKTPASKVTTVGKVEKNATKEDNMNRESSNEMQKATRTLSYIVLSFILTWLPNNIVYFLFAVEPSLIATSRLPRGLRQFFSWLKYGNSLLNPLCYAASQPLFRQTIFNMFCHPRKYFRD